jgi:hypothetical protein
MIKYTIELLIVSIIEKNWHKKYQKISLYLINKWAVIRISDVNSSKSFYSLSLNVSNCLQIFNNK